MYENIKSLKDISITKFSSVGDVFRKYQSLKNAMQTDL